MSKRFPIPPFDRDQYKNLEWTAPKLATPDECLKLIARARSGDAAAYGAYPVAATDAFYDRFKVQGPHRHAVMCLLPPAPVRVLGRSWAWYIQRALLVDSLDAASARVVQEWTTPRPMNTRLGPDDGVEVPGNVLYAVFGHRYSDHWIANRTRSDPAASGKGSYGVVSNSDETNHDFHSCNLTFSWA